MDTSTTDETKNGGNALVLQSFSKLPFGGGRLLVKNAPLKPEEVSLSVSPPSEIKTEVVGAVAVNEVEPLVSVVLKDTTEQVAVKEEERGSPSSSLSALPTLPTLPKKESILSGIENGKKAHGMKLSLRALSLLSTLKDATEKDLGEKRAKLSGSNISLFERLTYITLTTFEEKERGAFSLAFLMAALSRSSATLIETSVILSSKDRADSLPFISELIALKKASWENTSRTKMVNDAASALALAPLIAMEMLLTLISPKEAENPGQKDALNTEVVPPSEPVKDLVKPGEDIATIVRDELKKQLGDVPLLDIQNEGSVFNLTVKKAVEEIQKDPRGFDIDGNLKMLSPGSSVNREKIAELLRKLPPEISAQILKNTNEGKQGPVSPIAEDLHTLNAITAGEVPVGVQNEAKKEEETTSAVSDAYSDTINTVFLDDNFVKIVKLICKVTDTTNIEGTFKKYGGMTIKDFVKMLPSEGALIQEEMTAFINWAKNSYLKDKATIFESLTLVFVLTTIERGVSGATSKK